MPSVGMCDKQTRLWCCRIVLSFTILGVLCTMIFQIWSYYFYLVQQMDDQTFERPQIAFMLHACDDIRFAWNTDCTKLDKSWLCSFENPNSMQYYVEQIGDGNVTVSDAGIYVQSMSDCIRVNIWFIPW